MRRGATRPYESSTANRNPQTGRPAPMPYYYTSGFVHHSGDIVQPGNWGRVLAHAAQSSNPHFLEYVLEYVRVHDYPDKPRRMDCNFVFEEEEQALNWNRLSGGWREHVYEVGLTDDDANSHRGNFAIIENVSGDQGFGGLKRRAENYWLGDTGQEGAVWEIVSLSQLQITCRIRDAQVILPDELIPDGL